MVYYIYVITSDYTFLLYTFRYLLVHISMTQYVALIRLYPAIIHCGGTSGGIPYSYINKNSLTDCFPKKRILHHENDI